MPNGGAFLHQISVTGQNAGFLEKVAVPDNIKAEISKNTATFSSADRSELDKFKKSLINPIANIIETHYKEALIKHEFHGIEQLFKEKELNEAADYVKKHTSSEYGIRDKLHSFLAESDSLSIEGFINFRLTAFKNEIANLSAYAAERILSEREYVDFFGLLKEFISVKEPLFDVLHIIVTNYGGYYILDENLKPGEYRELSEKEIAALKGR